MRLELLVVLMVSLFFANTACNTSQSTLLEKRSIEQLQAVDWKIKEEGLSKLKDFVDEGHKLSKKTQKELVSALKKITLEAKVFIEKIRASGKTVSQADKEFYNEFPPQTYGEFTNALVTFIAVNQIEGSLPHVFSFLVEANYTAPPMVLILYGKAAINFLIEKAVTETVMERDAALSALTVWLHPEVESDHFDMSLVPQLDEEEVRKIKPVILRAAQDADKDIRYLSLFGLDVYLSDPTVFQLVKKMADFDQDRFVRERAKEILSQAKRILQNATE